LGLRYDGRVFAWGFNGHREGDIPPNAISGITQIGAGGYHSKALKDPDGDGVGEMIVWSQSLIPFLPHDNYNFIQVSGGGYSHAGLRSTGELACWGAGDQQLDDLTPAGNFGFVSAGDYSKHMAVGDPDQSYPTSP